MENQILIINTINGTLVSGRSISMATSQYKDKEGQYTNWAKTRLNRLAYEENKDFFVVKGPMLSESGRALTDHHLTFDAAIRLAKSERADWLVEYLTNAQAEAQPEITVSSVEKLEEQPESKGYSIAPEAPAIETHKPKTKLQKLLELIGEEEEQEKPQPEYEARLLSVEQKLDTVLSFFKIANQSLFGTQDDTNGKLAFEIASTVALPNSLVSVDDLPADPETTRAKLVQLVRAYGVYKNIKHRNIWTWLYEKLHQFYGFNAALNRQSEKENYLDAVERGGQIDNLYSIAIRHLAIPSTATA